MVQIKTSKERFEKKKEQRRRKDGIILSRFNENCKKYSITDAATITADEFNLSVMTIYNIRKRNSQQL